MNQPDPTQPMSPEDQALLKAAQENEVHALNEYLQNRVLVLNVEVRRRDAQIASLEAELAATRSQVHPEAAEPQADAWGPQDAPVSGSGPDAAPQ